MKRTLLALALPFWFSAQLLAEKPSALRIEAAGGPALTLRGKDARRQLQVAAQVEANTERDYTRKVTYRTEPAGIISITPTSLR